MSTELTSHEEDAKRQTGEEGQESRVSKPRNVPGAPKTGQTCGEDSPWGGLKKTPRLVSTQSTADPELSNPLEFSFSLKKRRSPPLKPLVKEKMRVQWARQVRVPTFSPTIIRYT